MNKVIIKGHQRSGNNYLIHLVGLNFFNTYNDDDFSDSNDHCILNTLQKDTKYLYIYRNKEDVLKSMYAERRVYGITVDDYEQFKLIPYVLMYEPTMKSDTTYSNLNETRFYESVQSFFFCCIGRTPNEWYDFHIAEYRKHEGENLLFVNYDNLKTNFNEEMNKISIFLTGKTKETYINIDTKVGWYH